MTFDLNKSISLPFSSSLLHSFKEVTDAVKHNLNYLEKKTKTFWLFKKMFTFK